VAAALALDPGGVLHAAGETGLVSAISSGAKPSPRIFGLAVQPEEDLRDALPLSNRSQYTARRPLMPMDSCLRYWEEFR
jgi:hypothetical protein